MKYLELPCTRCGEAKVIPPLKVDLYKPFISVVCDGCKKRSRYHVIPRADGTTTYRLSILGRKGRGLVLVSLRLEPWQAQLGGETVRFALDKGRELGYIR